MSLMCEQRRNLVIQQDCVPYRSSCPATIEYEASAKTRMCDLDARFQKSHPQGLETNQSALPYTEKLNESMPRRMAAVIEAKG